MNEWFSSDHHFDHGNIIGFSNRPFDSVGEMNERMIQTWNEHVRPDDTVHYLGDLCMGKLDHSLKYISRLNGKIILYPGNHDRCWIGRATAEARERWARQYIAAGIDQIVDTGAQFGYPVKVIAGRTVLLNHFPYSGDSHEMKAGDKYSAYRPDNEGLWLIHGHIHNNSSKTPVKDRQINVGVDVWDFIPVHIDWIKELIDGND